MNPAPSSSPPPPVPDAFRGQARIHEKVVEILTSEPIRIPMVEITSYDEKSNGLRVRCPYIPSLHPIVSDRMLEIGYVLTSFGHIGAPTPNEKPKTTILTFSKLGVDVELDCTERGQLVVKSVRPHFEF